MIKKLFFTAALLVPALAYGADPSANLPIQIVPASAVPAPAQAAGFTTLIINDNFQSAGFASTSTWLDCNDGTTPPANPLYWRAWVGFGTNINGPCSAITQATDPVGGQPALRIHWQDSYLGPDGSGKQTVVETVDSAGNGRQTPQGFYAEVVARTDIATGGPPNSWMDLWSGTVNSHYEIDGFEEGAIGGGGSNIHNNENGINSCLNPSGSVCGFLSVDVTQYHTYAWRQTSAGTDIVFCVYLDGSKWGCGSISPTSAELAGGPAYNMWHQFATGGAGGLGNGSTGKNTFIKSFKVWSCAGLNSSNLCHSSSNNP
jgi:hypothetical protein